jgi:hypothetical protein
MAEYKKCTYDFRKIFYVVSRLAMRHGALVAALIRRSVKRRMTLAGRQGTISLRVHRANSMGIDVKAGAPCRGQERPPDAQFSQIKPHSYWLLRFFSLCSGLLNGNVPFLK